MATTTTISGSVISDYVNVHKDELLTKATLDARTIQFLDIMPNVKYKDVIPTLDSEVTLQDGSQCGFNPTGSDSFGEKYIETMALKSEKSWCWKDFEKTWANYQLLWQAGREVMPFEEKIANHNLGLVQEELEDIVWNGDSGLSFNGIIDLMTDASASTINVSGVTSASSITDAVDAVVEAMPMSALKKGVNVFLSYSNLRKFILARNAACCFKDPEDAAQDTFKYPGDSRVTLVAVNGIGENYIVGAAKDAIVYATDVEDANAVYRMWFNEETEKFNWRVLFRAGIAFRYEDEVAYASLA